MRLLLNADDLGYSPVINQTIIELFTLGRLSSASLLVNMPYSLSAAHDLRAHSNLGVGVHLNLTKGRPLLFSKQIPSLVDVTGEFWPTKLFFVRALSGKIRMREVEAELRAQIEWVLNRGIFPTHLDSHSHWHLLPHLGKMVSSLAADYQILGIRQAAPRRTLLPSRFWLSIVKQEPLLHTSTLVPDYLLSLHQWMGAEGHPSALFFSKRLRDRLTRPEITLELVTHPGKQDDPDFPPDTLLRHQRQWEVDFLLGIAFGEWLEMLEAEVVDYRKLNPFAN